MYWISHLFLTFTIGIFIMIGSMLFEHPKTKKISFYTFLVTSLFVWLELSYFFISFISLLVPFMILLDLNRINWKKCTAFLLTFFGVLLVADPLVYQIPILFYPILLFIYLFLNRILYQKTMAS